MDQSARLQSNGSAGYLLFWPLFFLRYILLESIHPDSVCHPVACGMDEKIPLVEWFVIPYFLWHFCIVGMHLWLYRRGKSAYIGYSRYLMVSMGISTAIYLLYPTCQNLRPQTVPGETIFADALRLLYRMDTSTNVCPSEHVIGAAGFFLGAWYSGNKASVRTAAGIVAVLTAVSTVFLKQHSIVDVAAAVPVCIAAWWISFCPRSGRNQSIAGRTGYAES